MNRPDQVQNRTDDGLKKDMLDVSEDGSVLGKRSVCPVEAARDIVDWQEIEGTVGAKKKKGVGESEGKNCNGKKGGKEATGPGAAGHLAGADERARQET